METIRTQLDRRAILIEMNRRLENERYKYFVPNGRGEGFLTTLGGGEAFITLYSAANGVGKTATAVNALANIIWPIPGGHKWVKGPLYQYWPHLKNIRIVSDPQVVESIIKEMKLWFPKGRYIFTKGRKSYDAYWRTDTGFSIDIMTYDQDPKDFESANLGLIWLDEPPPRSIYKACIARLRRGGLLFITATPIRGSEWMYDEIITNPNNAAGKRVVVEAKMEDACIEHGVRGHLKHENIEKIIAQYDADEQQARVFGKFQHLTGLIFKQFATGHHVIPPIHINLKDYTVFQYLDPHPRTPDAVGWYAIDRKGTCYVIDELFMKCMGGDQELAARIREKDSMYRVEGRYGDPSMFIEDQHTQSSLASRLAKLGLYYAEATKARTAADRAISNALNFMEMNGQMIVAPKIYFLSTCKRHIWEMQHYRWDEWTGRSADKHGQKQKPLDKDDHMIENLGRFLFAGHEFIRRQKKNEEIKPINDDPFD